MVQKPFVLAGLSALALIASATLLRGHRAPAPRAATALRMDLEELVDRSELIVEARVLTARPVRDDQGRVLTEFELAVERTLEGEPAAYRTVRLPGGALPDGRITLVPGLPSLVPGEEVLLLLTAAGDQGVRVPVGLSQGKFRLVPGASGERVAVRDHCDVRLQLPGASAPVQGGQDALPHVELVARLTAAVNAKHARGPLPAEGR